MHFIINLFQKMKGKPQFVLKSSPAGPSPKRTVLSVKRNNGPIVKHTFCIKPISKWVRRARVGVAHVTGFDSVVDTCCTSFLSVAQSSGLPVDLSLATVGIVAGA